MQDIPIDIHINTHKKKGRHNSSLENVLNENTFLFLSNEQKPTLHTKRKNFAFNKNGILL